MKNKNERLENRKYAGVICLSAPAKYVETARGALANNARIVRGTKLEIQALTTLPKTINIKIKIPYFVLNLRLPSKL